MSTLTTVLVVSLIVVVLVGPAMWLLPSGRERRQMTLRQHAMRRGLRVQMSFIDDIHAPLEDRVSAGGVPRQPKIRCMAYRLPFEEPVDGLATVFWYRSPDDGTWSPQGPAAADGARDDAAAALVTRVVSRLPASSVALEVTAGDASVYWHERGDEEDVDRIVELLGRDP